MLKKNIIQLIENVTLILQTPFNLHSAPFLAEKTALLYIVSTKLIFVC